MNGYVDLTDDDNDVDSILPGTRTGSASTRPTHTGLPEQRSTSSTTQYHGGNGHAPKRRRLNASAPDSVFHSDDSDLDGDDESLFVDPGIWGGTAQAGQDEFAWLDDEVIIDNQLSTAPFPNPGTSFSTARASQATANQNADSQHTFTTANTSQGQMNRGGGGSRGDMFATYTIDDEELLHTSDFDAAGLEEVDLTTFDNSTSATRRLSEDEASKRQKREHGLAQRQQANLLKASIATQAQEGGGGGAGPRVARLGGLQCVICMDSFTDITATPCGHLFCHACINEALIAGENRGGAYSQPSCPFCRNAVYRNPNNSSRQKYRGLVPLEFKVRREEKSEKAKGKEPVRSSADAVSV